MFKKHGSITLNPKTISILPLLVFIAPLWGQHGAHTHGKAELNLVLNSDREIVAELISPAESVYGFEHAPRNAKETEQMKEGLKRLKASLSNMLVFEKQAVCKITEIDGESYSGAVEGSRPGGAGSPGISEGHEAHGQTEHTEKHHAHHGEKHGGKNSRATEDSRHRNVMIRWRVLCGADLTGQRMIVNWSEVLPDIHHIELTLLTQDRQDAISLRRSGAKIRL
ncbi:MAG: DUF2796 domain-containing protein [Acidobacteriota bacterium]|nr:DUF2796 domain-containing protein [Acidobacteriota bacterium]